MSRSDLSPIFWNAADSTIFDTGGVRRVLRNSKVSIEELPEEVRVPRSLQALSSPAETSSSPSSSMTSVLSSGGLASLLGRVRQNGDEKTESQRDDTRATIFDAVLVKNYRGN